MSNTLENVADWTGFDKACPPGAMKQFAFPMPDQLEGKLVLLRRGDTFTDTDVHSRIGSSGNKHNRLYIQRGQSNFKIGNFGNQSDEYPFIDAHINTNLGRFTAGSSLNQNAITQANTERLSNSDVLELGWSSNVYFEGLRIGAFVFAESFQHMGLHDINMDTEDSTVYGSGVIGFRKGVYCFDNPARIDCVNIPFPKGGYISKVDLVGSSTGGVNIVGYGCSMVNFTGLVDSRVRRAGDHNIRIMGWWRINLMRNFIRGENRFNANHVSKITLRSCMDSALFNDREWVTRDNLPAGYLTDPEGRTRADAYLYSTDSEGELTREYIHLNRYQVIHGNKIGDASMPGAAGTQYRTNAEPALHQDIILSNNIFENEMDRTSSSNISLDAYYGMCVSNTYATQIVGCYPSYLETRFPGSYREPTPIVPPLAPRN